MTFTKADWPAENHKCQYNEKDGLCKSLHCHLPEKSSKSKQEEPDKTVPLGLFLGP